MRGGTGEIGMWDRRSEAKRGPKKPVLRFLAPFTIYFPFFASDALKRPQRAPINNFLGGGWSKGPPYENFYFLSSRLF